MENKQIFREKNLNRITSADDLRECMHVTSPRLWMLLSVVLALVVGFIVFASLISMENVINTYCNVYYYEDDDAPFNEIQIAIPSNVGDIVHMGMKVRVDGKDGTIYSLFENEVTGKVCLAALDDEDALFTEDKVCEAQIILEKVSPISFLLN